MREIPLTRGLVAIVDGEDFEAVSMHKWYAAIGSRNTYAQRTLSRSVGAGTLFMHRFLLNPPADLYVDQINGNGLDNRRCNLRVATTRQNLQNARIYRSNTSGFKGVSRFKDRWAAYVKVDGRKVHLGYYSTPEEASDVRRAAAAEHYGDFARFA